MRVVLNVLVNNMDKDLVKALAMATSAGVTLVSCIGGFIWLGYKLDTWLQTEPLCKIHSASAADLFFYCFFWQYNTSFMWLRTVSMGMALGHLYNGSLLT